MPGIGVLSAIACLQPLVTGMKISGMFRNPHRSERRLYGDVVCDVRILGDHGRPRDLGRHLLRPWIAEGVGLVRWIWVKGDDGLLRLDGITPGDCLCGLFL